MYISLSYIIGLSFGVEYTDDEYFDYLVFDLFILRVMFTKEKDATD
jgi:hypothetical protein